MSTLAFELTPALEAGQPPEARGLARDEVRLMVASRSSEEIVHTRFRELPNHLRAGDLIVINNSATLPAAVAATREDGTTIEVRFATRAPRTRRADLFVVELRSAGGVAPLRSARAGEDIRLLGSGRLELLAPYARLGRLWLARMEVDDGLHAYLSRHEQPIRYSYVHQPWPLSAYQTVYATVPGSAEMPSAGRPFTADLLTRMVAAGTLIAPITLHAGVSSLESHEAPYPEEYVVPPTTARLVNAVRAWGGRNSCRRDHGRARARIRGTAQQDGGGSRRLDGPRYLARSAAPRRGWTPHRLARAPSLTPADAGRGCWRGSGAALLRERPRARVSLARIWRQPPDLAVRPPNAERRAAGIAVRL